MELFVLGKEKIQLNKWKILKYQKFINPENSSKITEFPVVE